VIATTLHGYEGSGRGFTHKFFKRLDALAPGWKHCQLQTPIRYPQNDPLENFIFKSLLLNAEPVRVDQTEELSFQDCKTKLIDKAELIKDESLLISIFGLLVNAHYQTKPSDLKLMLDDNSLSIYCLLTPQQQVVGVALMIREGGIETDLASQIYQGKRRVKGHLVAQALAANAGIEFSPCLMGERVSRLAIHPQLQNKGFGSYLLTTTSELITRCERNIRTDYISTSYGATTELINFWKKQDFKSVYLGMKRDASSGMNSVIMLKAVSDKGNKLVETAQLRFSKNYIQLLSEPFRDLNSELALSLLLDINTNNLPELTEAEKLELEAFAYHQRGYENTLYPIYNFVTKVLNKGQSKLSKIENNLLIVKILQKHSWGETKNKVGLAGKKQALQIVRQAIAKLISSDKKG
jgi:tRNA(Met) cytidine acetyltransferase